MRKVASLEDVRGEMSFRGKVEERCVKELLGLFGLPWLRRIASPDPLNCWVLVTSGTFIDSTGEVMRGCASDELGNQAACAKA
jgi:hypothetical protein